MDVRLTPQQSDAIHAIAGRALSVIDAATSERFVLIPEPVFLHLQGLAGEQDAACRERLKALIQEGIDSPAVPASEAFARLRAVASQLANQDA